jgi:peptidoglycan/LPS O-acetylase OafA/YrhL
VKFFKSSLSQSPPVIACIPNIIKINYDLTGAFYSPFTRFWELWLGSLISFYFFNENANFKNLRIKLSTIFSIFGIILIIYCISFYNKETMFPGWRALLPTLGASLLILSDSKCFINEKISVVSGLFNS